MTTSRLAKPEGNLKYRDDWHAYWWNGTRTKSVTTVAKIGEDTYALDEWRKRQIVIGMATDATLGERAAAHFDDRDQIKKIAEEAMSAARSHDAAERGTAAHRITERVDLGEQLIETPFSRAVRDAWLKALDGAGLEIVPEYVERVVVYPDIPLCGRFDRLAKRRRDGKLVVVDLKTGESAVKYPHSTAKQLALYANAPLLAAPFTPAEGGTEEFSKLPENLDKKWAYIVHMPGDADDLKVEVIKIEIASAWKIVRDAIFPMLAYRKLDDLVSPVSSVDVVDPNAEADPERVAWIRGRINGISLVGEQAKDLVRLRWPAGMPGRGPWSEADVDVLDAVLASVEKDCSAGFPVRDPAIQVTRSAA